MKKQKEDLFMMSKSRKPTLAEWTLQNGIILNQNSKPKTTAVGAIHKSPAKTTTVTTKTQKRDPFLEGFYSVEDKPETEKRTYLQHRETSAPLSSRPERKRSGEISSRFLDYARNDTGSANPLVGDGVPDVPQKNTNPAAPAQNSPVKIVGDNVTEKDYEDFWEAFRKESTADKLGWVTENIKQHNVPTAYFSEGKPWMSPAKETDDYRKKAGREYAKNIIDDLFFGDSNVLTGWYPEVMTPVTESKYRDILEKERLARANAEYLAGLGSMVSPTIDATKNAVEFREMLGTTGDPIADTIFTVASIAGGVGWTLLDKETIPGIINTHGNLYKGNKTREQFEQMLDYIEESDYKYLADWDEARKKYIEDLWDEVKKLESTKQLGYLPPEENEVFKEEAINALKRIIYLNESYDIFRKKRDRELTEAARLN